MTEKIQSLNELREKPNQKELLKQQLYDIASLDLFDYSITRKETAKKLGLNVGTLDKIIKDIQKESESKNRAEDFKEWIIKPWPNPVKGDELFSQIFETMKRFIIADKESLEAATMWTALTWLVDYATVLPIAMITAPEKGCGKTVFLSTIQEMTCRPIQACNISSSSLFRSVEQWQPTLLIDEADSFLKENEELRGILNSGHTRNSAYVIRTEEVKGEWQPVKFKTWSAKAISGIKLENLSPTLTSRAILLPLRKKKPSENTENLRHADQKQFEIIKSKLCRWALDNGEKFSELAPELPELQNRDGDNWEPLLAIAQLASAKWFSRIRNAALKIIGKADNSLSLEQELLADIQEVFIKKGVDRISSVNLIEALLSDELGPWQTYNRGYPITARQLARKLKPYSIQPNPIKIAGVTRRGYSLSDFTDTFDRYLSFSPKGGNLSVTALQPANSNSYSNLTSVTEEKEVTHSNSIVSAIDEESNTVTLKKGGIEEKKENEIVEVEI